MAVSEGKMGKGEGPESESKYIGIVENQRGPEQWYEWSGRQPRSGINWISAKLGVSKS